MGQKGAGKKTLNRRGNIDRPKAIYHREANFE
jgi:hypothetical protein